MSETTASYQSTETTLPNYSGGQMHNGARATFVTIGIVMILSGVIGNFLFLFVLLRQFRNKRSIHILFLANLSLADLLTLGYCFTHFVLDLILNRHPVVNHAHCVVNGVVLITMLAASILFLVSISLNRYLHVCHSHLYSRVFTLPRTVAWCLLIWLASLLLALIPVLEGTTETSYRYNKVTHFCSFSRQGGLSYVKIIVIVCIILPVLIIAYCNVAIFRYWRRVRFRYANQSLLVERKQKRREKAMARWRARRQEEKKDGATDTAVAFLAKEDQSHEELPELLTGFDTLGAKENEPASHSYSALMAFGSSLELGSETENRETQEREMTDGAKRTIDKEDRVIKTADERPVVNEETENQQSQCSDVDAVHSSTSPPNPIASSLWSLTSTLGRLITAGGTAASETQRHRTAIRDLQKMQKKKKAREVAFVRSLFVVFLLTICSFVPYGVVIVLAERVTIPPEVVIMGNLFAFVNNSVNWIVYGAMNPVFRRRYIQCLRQLVKVCCHSRDTRAEQSTVTASSNTVSVVTPSLQRRNAESLASST
ncbi:hypothetical protein V1264_021639 [Littorina saxatilis]|uniref:G-protein coupled receptors family 1 profile domain-containing protein n=1 Tax=Littorina saxatilis TaxID=31220 RepID=A0AAN9AIK2_9CAEN